MWGETSGHAGTASRTYLAEGVLHNGAGTQMGLSFMHQDRLGSALVITDKGGLILGSGVVSGVAQAEFRSFDAFGKARDNRGLDFLDGRLFAGVPNGKRNRKGFTGHEHLDEAGLIHMNGRAYDYNLGRFYGVDPVIQFPTNSQSLNGYSYLMNNPLSGTDPTGYCMRSGTRLPVTCTTTVRDADGKALGKATVTKYDNGKIDLDYKGAPGTNLIDNGAPASQTTSGEPRAHGDADTSDIDAYNKKVVDTGRAAARTGGAALEVINPIPKTKEEFGISAALIAAPIVGKFAYKLLSRFGRFKDEVTAASGKLAYETQQLEKKALSDNYYRPGCSGISCFVAGTPVLTAEGLKPIELIQLGELVSARNELTGETRWQRVEQVIVTHDREVWDYIFVDSLGNEETLGATPIHPFHTPDGLWVEVGKLAIGAQVSSFDGRVLRLQSKVMRPAGQTTYNFEVAGDHTYFVGTFGVWVHNGVDCALCPGLGKAAVEELTRLRLQNRLGTNIYSATAQNAPDYFDSAGRTYDQMGNPAMAPFWNKQSGQFFNQIQDHLRKADFTVIDLTGLPANIRSDVGNHVMNLPQSQFDKIIPIGF